MISSLSGASGRSTKNSSSKRPFRSSSGGRVDTSLAVATMNTFAVNSCIQNRNCPIRRRVVPPSEPCARPFSISSIHSTHGATRSAVARASRSLPSDCPTYMPSTEAMSRRYSGSPHCEAMAFADSDLPHPGTPTSSTPFGGCSGVSVRSAFISCSRGRSQSFRFPSPPTVKSSRRGMRSMPLRSPKIRSLKKLSSERSSFRTTPLATRLATTLMASISVIPARISAARVTSVSPHSICTTCRWSSIIPATTRRISSLFGSSRATLMPSRDSPVHTGDEEIRMMVPCRDSASRTSSAK